MRRTIIVFGLLTALVLVVVGWYALGVDPEIPPKAALMSGVTKIMGEDRGEAPEELGTTFDPTVNTVVFRVQETKDESWVMDIVYPAVAARQVVAILACEGGVIGLKGKQGETVSEANLREVLGRDGSGSVMLYAHCSSVECQKIVGECEATLVGRQR